MGPHFTMAKGCGSCGHTSQTQARGGRGNPSAVSTVAAQRAQAAAVAQRSGNAAASAGSTSTTPASGGVSNPTPSSNNTVQNSNPGARASRSGAVRTGRAGGYGNSLATRQALIAEAQRNAVAARQNAAAAQVSSQSQITTDTIAKLQNHKPDTNLQTDRRWAQGQRSQPTTPVSPSIVKTEIDAAKPLVTAIQSGNRDAARAAMGNIESLMARGDVTIQFAQEGRAFYTGFMDSSINAFKVAGKATVPALLAQIAAEAGVIAVTAAGNTETAQSAWQSFLSLFRSEPKAPVGDGRGSIPGGPTIDPNGFSTPSESRAPAPGTRQTHPNDDNYGGSTSANTATAANRNSNPNDNVYGGGNRPSVSSGSGSSTVNNGQQSSQPTYHPGANYPGDNSYGGGSRPSSDSGSDGDSTGE
jgi:hypothetical protein